jgi:transposase-like protein
MNLLETITTLIESYGGNDLLAIALEKEWNYSICEPPERHSKMREFEKEKALFLYSEGVSVRKISRALNRPESSIYQLIKKVIDRHKNWRR